MTAVGYILSGCAEKKSQVIKLCKSFIYEQSNTPPPEKNLGAPDGNGTGHHRITTKIITRTCYSSTTGAAATFKTITRYSNYRTF